ncbi:MAG: squalene--hopene cyclase [Dehalococcoidia bacterium]
MRKTGTRTGKVRVGVRPTDGALAQGVEGAIKRCQQYMLGQQEGEGYWSGELEANVTITSEYLLLTHFLGVPDRKRWDRIVGYLRSKQLPDGAWNVYYGGPSDLNVSVEAYFAMKLAGVSPDEPFMARARQFILSRGGLPGLRNFTKIWLSLFGQWDWNATPMMPPEIMLLPPSFPFNIYEFSSWARATIVPMLIILTKRPLCPIPDYARISELYPPGCGPLSYTVRDQPTTFSWQRFFIGLDGLLRLWEKVPLKPGRNRAIEMAERWIVEHQEADGSWGGIQPPWVYSLIALKCLGYSMDHPVMAKGFKGFEGFAIQEDGTFRTQPCLSPVWDTAWAVIALRESGLAADHPSLIKSGRWLLKEQITVGGDWCIKYPDGVPGGWAFEFANDLYPDTDDVAEVIIALMGLALDREENERAIRLGVDWLLGMQSRNGGWGSFDKDNDKRFVTRIPFCDFGEVIDPPSADVTAHILELLGMLGYRPGNCAPAGRALRYLKREQEVDGSWFGRWGVNYVYGIGAVLPALKAIGEDMAQPYVRRAVRWIKEHQNADGGWGESCDSYVDPSLRGLGTSTASQTAWALLSLLAAGEAASPEAQQGVRYLVEAQEEDGSWEEDYFTATGFPGDFLIKYHMYRIYFPLLALGRYQKCLLEGALDIS